MSTTSEPQVHRYAARVIWTGNSGRGTVDYGGYGRDYSVVVRNKPTLAGSADVAFRGSPERHNPEDLFLAAIGACHMLFYLSLCARSGVRVLSYEDEVTGELATVPGGGGRFESVTLSPVVTVAGGTDIALARTLHGRAQERCFIANSCSVPIGHCATVRSAGTPPAIAGACASAVTETASKAGTSETIPSGGSA
jgi:organic hydroperoxide reductase OsmC/OhrA